ncbi:MAG: hypothetical protein FD123_2406 [Bacteroidetes bacterium]|nr:MAG: hypothetical protein FD123_2406 [Bacteroidota bacterium]
MNLKELEKKYLGFSGQRSIAQVKNLLAEANNVPIPGNGPDAKKLIYIRRQLTRVLLALINSRQQAIIVVIEEDNFDFLEDDKSLGKFSDKGKPAPGSKQDKYWERQGYTLVFDPESTTYRKGPKLPANLKFNSEQSIIEYFHLAGVEYGNWLSQNDRINYLAGAAMGLFDMMQILGFNAQQVGMYELITLAFGARGSGSAVAHFERDSFAINITRYDRPPAVNKRPKDFDRKNYLKSLGGVGALVHEYGHALDCYAGRFIEKDKSYYASGGRSLRATPDKKLLKQKSLHGVLERIIAKMLWDSSGKNKSAFHERLLKIPVGQDYYLRRNELFARAFEVYFQFKMKKAGRYNYFIHEKKYDGGVYLTEKEAQRILPDMDEFIRMIKPKIKKVSSK